MLLRDSSLSSIFDVSPPGVRLEALNSMYDEAPLLYDRLYGGVDFDIPFWKHCADESVETVLELGVGTGRVALPLAASGKAVTGVDRSLAALKLARTKAQSGKVVLDLVKEDFRSLYLNKRFDLIIAPANVINECFTPVDIDQLLDSVKQHLSSSGKFIFAARNSVAIGNTDKPKVFDQRDDEDARGYKLDWQRVPYSHLTQLCIARVGENSPQESIDYYMAHRIYYPDELTSTLYRHGLRVDSTAGNYNGDPLSASSMALIMRCTLR